MDHSPLDRREKTATAPLAPGLYLVATPIGAARDVTLRALDILGDADLLAAEDTRMARKLLDIHGVVRTGGVIPYHDHNGAAQRPRILAALAEGKSVALVSDAGTPLVADPGYKLVVEALAAGHEVRAAPGPSAALAALSVSGLPTDRFMFSGFPPPKAQARRRWFAEIAEVPATLVFYESPKRLSASLSDMAETLGGERACAVCRELTKRFEETRRGSLAALASEYAGEAAPKGEVVVVVGAPVAAEVGPEALDSALRAAMEDMSLRDAAAEVAKALNLPRKTVYARALELGRET